MNPDWLGRLGSVGGRFASVALAELNLDARKLACTAVSRGLPQFGFVRARTALLRAAGIPIGVGSLFLGPLNVTGPGDVRVLLSVGARSFITGPLHVDLGAAVRIGNNVQLGHDVALLTIDHEIGPSEHRCANRVMAPIVVGDGAWLASRVVVLPGVTVGKGAVVAAGAVVTRDVAPDTLVAGVPARFVRNLEGTERRASARLSGHPRIEG
jgi:maltose O-acetyltransferase